MPEVRIDPLSGLRTIVASDRAARPGGGLSRHRRPIRSTPRRTRSSRATRTRRRRRPTRCAPTAPRRTRPGWRVRVVPNLYPALDPESAEPEPFAKPDLFAAAPARGGHEVVINAPDPVHSLADLEVEQVVDAPSTCGAQRMRTHTEDGAAYVHVIVNERREAGASLPHTHAQIYALDFVPAIVARERERFGAYAQRTMGGNLLQDLVQEEVKLARPHRRHRRRGGPHGALRRAAALPAHARAARRRGRASRTTARPAPRCCTTRLRRLGRKLGNVPPLNLWVRTAPLGADHFCWRIDIVPRLTHMAGLELGTGVHLNIVAPEQAAAELREVWPDARARAARQPRRRARRRRDRRLDRRRDARPARRHPRRRRGRLRPAGRQGRARCGSSPTPTAA